MLTRLNLCSKYLAEVEAKLLELKDEGGDASEHVRITEALSFVDKAIDALSETRARIDESVTKMQPPTM